MRPWRPPSPPRRSRRSRSWTSRTTPTAAAETTSGTSVTTTILPDPFPNLAPMPASRSKIFCGGCVLLGSTLQWYTAASVTSASVRASAQRHPDAVCIALTATAGLSLGEFTALYPDIRISLIVTDEELDLSMREADVAIRLRQPTQGDLIQRRLFTVHFHVYASTEYIKGHGMPKDVADLEEHRIMTYGGIAPSYLLDAHFLTTVGRDPRNPRTAALTVNNITALKRAVQEVEIAQIDRQRAINSAKPTIFGRFEQRLDHGRYSSCRCSRYCFSCRQRSRNYSRDR